MNRPKSSNPVRNVINSSPGGPNAFNQNVGSQNALNSCATGRNAFGSGATGFNGQRSGVGPGTPAGHNVPTPPAFNQATCYPDDFGQGGFGSTDYTKIIIFGCVMLAVMALGGILFKLTSSPAPAVAAPPVVPLHVQAQQAAIEALNAHQQMMIEMRRQMAEAERGYYEEGPARYGDGGW